MVKTLELILDLVIFQMSDKEFCADTKKVITILKPEELSYIPDTEKKGVPVLMRDNKEFMVVNINNYLNLKNSVFTSETRAILLEMEDQRMVFFVDKVIEIISIDSNFATVLSEFHIPEERDYIDGIIKYEDREFVLPDYKKIASHAKQNL